jgi:linoleoyl-CoA desaturase
VSVVKETTTPVKALPFTKQYGFRKTLNERVDAYLRENDLPARDAPAMYAKTAIILTWYVATYALILYGGAAGFPLWVSGLLCVVFGLSIAGIGFGIMHDAIHGGYSNHPRVNKLLGLTMELVGTSSFLWRQKHNVWHHTYTNIAGLDEDLETRGLLRLSPHDEWKPRFRFQHLYVPFVYGMTGFGFLSRDFQVYFTGKSDEWHVYPRMGRNDKITFWLGKLVFFLIMFGLPLLVYPWWQVLIGFFIVVFTVGVTLASIFQLAHVMGPAEFPEPVGDPLRIENEWAIHQVETTVNFAPKNKFLNWYAGGLNFQIEHHLFPHICHVNYPKIMPIVQQTCEEFGVKYSCYPTWREALVGHWCELKLLGRKPQTAVAGTAIPSAGSLPAK